MIIFNTYNLLFIISIYICTIMIELLKKRMKLYFTLEDRNDKQEAVKKLEKEKK